MADHHIDTMDGFDYVQEAETLLKQRGLFIVSNPHINHKPGNDWWSDVYYPLPTFPDNRFANPSYYNNEIKNDIIEDNTCKCPCMIRRGNDDLIISEEQLDDDMEKIRSIKNPVISYIRDDGKPLLSDVVYSYTGLTLQAVEKKAYDISFLKPVVEDNTRTVKLHTREVITGHLLSIATFDGYKYHIFRGLCIDILKIDETDVHIKDLDTMHNSMPYGRSTCTDKSAYEDSSKLARRKSINPDNYNKSEDLVKRNLRIVLDTSEPFKSSMECIPVNQIIDIQEYNHMYDFTIYEGDLKLLWDDWFQVIDKKDQTWVTYVPDGPLLPQQLLHPVIEHQKPNKIHWE